VSSSHRNMTHIFSQFHNVKIPACKTYIHSLLIRIPNARCLVADTRFGVDWCKHKFQQRKLNFDIKKFVRF